MHRDIKPANIWLEQPADAASMPRVKILDFGLARSWDTDAAQITQSGMIVGTPAYMAPEQAASQPLDARADIFSLGAVLYRMLTGNSPFARGSTLATLSALAVETPKPPRDLAPEVSGELSDLVLALLAKQAGERPASARQVSELLRIAATAKPVKPCRSSRPPSSRRYVIAAAAGFLVLLTAVWIIIRDKDGNELARIKTPDGSTVTTQNDPVPKPVMGKTPVPMPAAVATSSIPQPNLTSTPANTTPSTKPAEIGEVAIDLPPWTLAKDAPPPAVAPFTKDAAKQLQTAWAKYLGRKVVQENSLGMSLALIPPGEFDTIYTELNRSGITPEMARRRLRISQAFDLGATEVTVAQFRQFVDATGYATDAEKNGKGGFRPDNDERKPEWTWKSPGPYKQSDDMPVVQISWNDATAFCDWLSKKEGARYRLPTEAEWEFACRAGSDSYHAVCEKLHDLTQYAWVRENGSLGGAFVRPVGNWKANAFGLFDVLGNAWEWCADGGDRRSAEWTHAVDPWGYFVYPNVRGCGFEVAAKDAHPAFRRERRYELQRSSIGFRVLRQVSPDAPPGPLDQPLLVSRNSQLFRQALVAKPVPIAGLRSWSVELAGSGHKPGSTRATVWSPTGDRIATSDESDPLVRLWDRNGKLVQVLVRHTTYVPRLTFSPDGKWLATVEGSEGRYCIWNVRTGGCHAVITTQGTGRPAFSPDGSILAVLRGSQTTFQTLDLNTGRILGSAGGIGGTGGGATGDYITWSPDGKTIATVNVRDSIYFHTAPGLQKTERVPAAKNLYMLAWSPDGKWLAAAEHNEPGNVSIYDARTHALKTTLDRKKLPPLKSLSWSKDSRRLLEGGGSDRFFIIWDALTGEELLRSTGGSGPAAWSPDEQEIVVGGTPVRIFDAQTGLLKRAGVDVGRSVSATYVSVCTDAERLFINNSSGTITILNAQTGVLVDRWEKLPSGRVSIAPTKDQLAIFGKSIDKNLFLIDAATGKKLRELKPHPQEILTVSWSPDGQRLASGGKDKVLRIWNVADAKLQHELTGHGVEIHALAWSPDGKQLASADVGAISLWDPAKGSLVATHQAPGKLGVSAAALAWTPDSQSLWVTLQRPGSTAVRLDVATATWSEPPPGPSVTGFFPSPDARHQLFSVSNLPFMYRRDETSQTGGFLKTEFRGCQWHPDSRRFVSDLYGIGWIRGYDIEADQPLGVVMPAIIGNNWLVVGPEGHYNGPKSIEDHLIYVAQTDTGEQVTLSPTDFAQRYGWKNDPAQARLLGPPTTVP